MMKHKRILVPVDLSKPADRAFEYALKLAQRSGADLYLLHAVAVDRPFGHRAVERLSRFADLRRRADAAGVAIQTVEQHGDAAKVIVLHAATRPIDLIVMASGRRSGWARLRQPSIAEKVMRRGNVPTLIVRDDGEVRGTFDHVVAAAA
jgi:nucleotide-binding universal stress UspA family protein